LRIGGMPPFWGFFVKLLILQQMMIAGKIILRCALIWGAAYFLYIYLQVFLTRLISYPARLIKGGLIYSGLIGSLLFILLVLPWMYV
jgi:NADH:ubiquinone oxidoreductase subunit 2 (subunit N)